jgi:hypothetical protein
MVIAAQSFSGVSSATPYESLTSGQSGNSLPTVLDDPVAAGSVNRRIVSMIAGEGQTQGVCSITGFSGTAIFTVGPTSTYAPYYYCAAIQYTDSSGATTMSATANLGNSAGDAQEISLALLPATVTMTLSYTIVGSGSPTPPVFNYVQGGVSQTSTLTSTPTPYPVDPGSSWSVSPNPLSGSSSSERWDSNQALSGSASAVTIVFTFYHQFLQTLSYALGGSPAGSPAAPSFTANQFGASTPQTLSTTPTGYWFDAGATWSVGPNPLTGSTGTERWYSNQLLAGTVSSAQTFTFTFYHQFSVNFGYTVVGGGSPTAPTTTFTQFGSSTPVTASVSLGTQAWVDAGSTYTYSNPLGSSSGTERWDTNSATGSISASGTINPSFYHQYLQTLSYSLAGTPTGSPTAPCFQADQFGSQVCQPLTTSATGYWFDAGVTWIVGPNPLTGSGASERWQSPPSQALTGTVSSAQTLMFTFYHQFLWTLSYAIVGGGSPTAPTFTANQFGSPTSQVLMGTPTVYWFDNGIPWSVTNPLGGSTSSERWALATSQPASGTISSSQTITFTYYHQYYLTMEVAPFSNFGTVAVNGQPGSSWVNAGSSVMILATPASGVNYPFVFTFWAGTGSGSYSGSTNPAPVTMNGPITEIGYFTGPSVGFDFFLSKSGGITVNQGGSGSNIITVTAIHITSQSVSLSCTSVLPSGAACAFNPASNIPPFQSTLTITTSPLTPVGSYTINVTGTRYVETEITMFTLRVNPVQSPELANHAYTGIAVHAIAIVGRTTYQVLGQSPREASLSSYDIAAPLITRPWSDVFRSGEVFVAVLFPGPRGLY